MVEFLQIVELNYYNEARGTGGNCYEIGTDKTRTIRKMTLFKCIKQYTLLIKTLKIN